LGAAFVRICVFVFVERILPPVRLFAFETRWAETIARAILPVGALGGVVDDLDLGARFRDECAQPPWFSGLLLRATLWLVWLAPLYFLPGLRTFGAIEASERAELLEKLLKSNHHNLRLAVTYLKLTTCVLALGDPRALEQLDAYGLGEAARKAS
jgi:hypothetical protein